jgi:flavin-dependent dehydrogenase
MAEKYITEPAQDIKVFTEAEVVVVGGGPGGHSAAVAAARNGAKTVLVERYGHLGGMATGGIVIQIPHMSDGSEEQQIAGLTQEWIDRLDPIGGVLVPQRGEIGSTDEKLVSYWRRFMGNVNKGRIEYTAWVDPELLKCVLNDMVEDAGIKLLLHSWGTRAIAEDGIAKGVIFESKSGRQAVMGKVIIDGTGDGDLLPSAGAEWEGGFDPSLRSSMLALVFRIGNCDYQKYCDFRETDQDKAQSLMNEMTEVA